MVLESGSCGYSREIFSIESILAKDTTLLDGEFAILDSMRPGIISYASWFVLSVCEIIEMLL